MKKNLFHPLSLVESGSVGSETFVWAFAHLQKNVSVGKKCNIGEGCFVENGVTIGDRVTIKNGVCLWEGIQVENDVFIGPNVAFANDRHPRSPRSRWSQKRYHNKKWLSSIQVAQGCSIGANATIVGPVRLGKFCMVGAGAVVTSDVGDYELVVGAPARCIGWVDRHGKRVNKKPK